MVRPHAIIDHTTAIRNKSWQDRADGRSNANPMVEIDSMTMTEKRVLAAFKQALGDYKTHKLSTLLLQSNIKALLAEVKLPHTKVRHILKNVPAQILFHAHPTNGEIYLVLKEAMETGKESTSGSSSRQGSTVRQHSRQLSASVPASSSRPSAGPSKATTAPVASSSKSTGGPSRSADDTASETEDTDSDSSLRNASTSQNKNDGARRHSGSTWGMKRPKEQQMHTKEVANASTSPQKRDRFAHPGPRKSAPTASTSTPVQRESDTPREAVAESDEEDLLTAISESQSVAPESRSSQQVDGTPVIIPIRKQPEPPSIAAVRETLAEHGLDSIPDEGMGSTHEDFSYGNAMVLDGEENTTITPSHHRKYAEQEQYGEEIPLEQVASQAGPSRLPVDVDENGDDDFDLDMVTRRRSASRSHQRTSSGGGSARKEVPDLLFDGYKAMRSRGRSVRPGPPGMDEASTRDSSVQEAESVEDQELDDAKSVDLKVTATKRGPTKPGTVPRRSDDDGSSDSDTVVVTSVRAGAPPAKTREQLEAEREQRQRDRKEHEARREARRPEREKSSRKRKRNPLPNFRNTQGQEASELKAAYQTYLADLRKLKNGLEGSSANQVIDLDAEEAAEALPDIATVAEEKASWTQVFSYETHKTRANRPDYNTVKFWPYNLPFPGRRKDEAIVAMAGGCVVRVFRLSEKRGITELWNVVDESISWEREELREVFYSCAWTHDVRREAGIAAHWRKWPILCVAGIGKEVKILDGYSGALLKVIQGHGGPIYSLAAHPALPHVIATASGDEAISLWDISVPVSKPETAAGHGMLEELDKRRKGYAAGERLCVFGGYAGHVEAILSISIHPSLPLLMSGGGDCKLRIWRIPDNLPSKPTSSLTCPEPIDTPDKSSRPPSFAFPIFTQTSLHSHHIDHVEWVGHAGHILTRSLCYDAPGKRVIRLFRPNFFDTFQSNLAKPADVVGFDMDFGPQVELLARWTSPSCSGGIGDGVVCTATELVQQQNGQLAARRRVYIPSIEPAMHIYDLDVKVKQPDIQDLLHKYPFKLGDEILFEDDKRKNSVLKAVDCQTAGRGWLVSVGEGEKISIWKRKDTSEWSAAKGGLGELLRDLRLSEDRDSSPELDSSGQLPKDPPEAIGGIFAEASGSRPQESPVGEQEIPPISNKASAAFPAVMNGVRVNGNQLPSPPPEDPDVLEAVNGVAEVTASVVLNGARDRVVVSGADLPNVDGLQDDVALPAEDNEEELWPGPNHAANGMEVDEQHYMRSPSVEYVD